MFFLEKAKSIAFADGCWTLFRNQEYKTSLVPWQIEAIWDNNLYFMECPERLPRLFQEPVLPEPRRIQAKFLPIEVNGRFTDHLMASGSDLI